jgi:hypothetical protein
MPFDVPVYPIQSAFSRGEVSPFLFGRVDLLGWSQGLRTLRNATVRPEGAVMNRQGFNFNGACLTNVSKGSILVPFVFSATQSYVIEIGVGTAQVFSQGDLVIGATFSTPWATQDLLELRWSQSADTLTLVHVNYPPYEIKRVNANTFTCTQASYINGPFLQQNTDGTTFVFASAKSGTVTLTSTSPIFNANHVGALFQLQQQDLSIIQPWEPTKQFTGSSIIGQYRRASGKNYLAVSLVGAPGSFGLTGTWIPSHSQGVQADGDGLATPTNNAGVNWLYQDSGFGIVKITGFTSSTVVTGVVQPNYVGGPGLLPISVVGGPQVAFGPFTFSGNGVTKAFSPLTGATSTDPNKFYVLVNGVYQAPALYTVSGTTITFLNAPPSGTNNIVVSQISALGQTTFWSFGAFSADQGYPGAVTYFPDRLVLAGTAQQPVGCFGSKTSQYHDFGVSNPVVASDAFAVFLNARQLNAISDLIPLSDLLVGTSNIIWRLWPGQTGVALSPLAISSNPQNYYGENPACAAVLFGDAAIFPTYDGRRLRDLLYQFAFDKFMGQELTLYSRHLIPVNTQFQRLQYKPDISGDLIFGLRTDGVLLVCTYLREQQIIGWGHYDTQGTFEDICVVPEEGRYDLYVITRRLINGQWVRYVEQAEQREAATIYDYQFLDCNLTYDGRNTSATTMILTGGTTWLAGDTGTLTASGTSGWAQFQSTDVGNEIWIYSQLQFIDSVGGQTYGTLTVPATPGAYPVLFANGESRVLTVASDGITCSWQQPLLSVPVPTADVRARCVISAVTSTTVASVTLRDPCAPMLRARATAEWTFARKKFTGAAQLAGQDVVAYADANVIGINSTGTIPNGDLTVDLTGTVILPNACGVVQLGLPYISDFETLPLNIQGQETIRQRAKAEPVIFLDVTETRNFLVGTDFGLMFPVAQRAFETYVAATSSGEGVFWTRVASTLDQECHTCIRQNMPLPITIRAVIPSVGVGEPVS